MYYSFCLESNIKLKKYTPKRGPPVSVEIIFLTKGKYVTDDKPSIDTISFSRVCMKFPWKYICIQHTPTYPSCFILIRLVSMFRSTGL